MKKVLFVSNVLSHIYAFHLPYITWFKEHGFEVHVMANSNGQQAEGFDKYYVLVVRTNTKYPVLGYRNLQMDKRGEVWIEYNKLYIEKPSDFRISSDGRIQRTRRDRRGDGRRGDGRKDCR